MEVDGELTMTNEEQKLHKEKGKCLSGQQKRSEPPPPGVRQNYELKTIIMENELLFKFYRQQGIIPEDEWELFIETLKIELPVSFRIQISLREKEHMAAFIESKFIPEITDIAALEVSSGIDPPKRIPFIPFAYQTKMSRQAIRSHHILKDFHEFLINETDLGCISRQEFVSMLPPLLLRIEPHHMVLDACAAPGSKTMQLLELMHKDTPNPEGMLVANDADYKRCYLLVHQTLKRIPSANCVVTSHDAGTLPTMLGPNQQPVLFDRILCDVICSGDGTFRKNPELWRNWEPMKGVHLHKLQLQIARRCLELLKPGGLMCYSTCSLNPLEDEAVIAQLMRLFKGAVELVDVSGELVGLKRTQGISSWKVYNKAMKEFASFEEVPEGERRHLKPSMFPPTKEEAEKMHLEHAFRILPHHQNTGGFFVAILRKTQPSESTDEQQNVVNSYQSIAIAARKPAPAKRRRYVNKEDPFVFLAEKGEENELRQEMQTHFGIPADTFPYRNLLVRSNNVERKKEIYFVNDKLREFLTYNADRFKIVNAGLGILKKIFNDKVAPCPYRLKQDGLPVLIPWITKRTLDISAELLVHILKGGKNAKELVLQKKEGGLSTQYVPMSELGEHSLLFRDLDPGSVILRIRAPFPREICAWMGANSVSAFVSREERFHLLSIFGEDVSGFRRNANTARQEKARRLKNSDDQKKEGNEEDNVAE